MVIFWILLNLGLKRSDKGRQGIPMSKMNKTEKIISVLYAIAKAPGHRIGEAKLCELLGNPSRANKYKLIDELTKGMGSIPPILIEEAQSEDNDKIYKLNNSAWENFVYADNEGFFFLEAFKKIGNVLNCDYTHMAFNDAFEFEGQKITDPDRKFIYLNKITARIDEAYKQNIDRLVSALVSNKKLKIAYSPGDQEHEYTREIEPLTLCQYRDDLYILCYKVEGSERIQRNYKVSRITEIEVLDQTFKYPSKKKWDPENKFQRASGLITGEEKLATFRVYGVSRVAFQEKDFFNSILIQSTDEYDQYQCHYSHENEFIGQLFVYGQDIEIMASAHLREQFTQKAQEILKRNNIQVSAKKSA